MGIPTFLNKKDYADLRGVSERTVGRWLSEGLPHDGSGKKGDPIQINLNAAIAWEIEREVEKQLGGKHTPGDESTTYAQEELLKLRAERRIKEAEADLKEVERDEKAQQVIDLEQASIKVAEALTQISIILKPVGRKIIPKVMIAQNEAQGLKLWDDEVNRAFTTAANILEELAINEQSASKNTGSDGQSDSTSATSNSMAMG
ncbi:terminase small subunit [Spartinivicinus poritis]|uniref:Terminase small subunit n=1 Tax=Spartinivicinus poritis TaxID=2994640 RepID=A0ABT5UEJ1_9GAMM|nr:terminase small subunit [Spartinivicinus sp. A2-2]MDE1464800.1 terminase small subunit [Spartinivicinus sp. A2-2]